MAAFGGNQFDKSQSRHLQTFFSVFYLSINVGSLISTFLTPIFRSDVKCFGNDCYALAFGVPAVFMLIAVAFFVIGTPFYKRSPPSTSNKDDNVIVNTVGCIVHAAANRAKNLRHRRNHVTIAQSAAKARESWLDYADDKYSAKLIGDVKRFCKVLVVFSPLPIFWALYDQQGSRWTEQAQQLDGRLGSAGITVKPDQFQVVNPVLIVLFVPLFDMVVYPLLGKCGLLTRPLQRMSVGLVLAIGAFLIAAALEHHMQTRSAALNPAVRVRLLNLAPCELTVGDAARVRHIFTVPQHASSGSVHFKMQSNYLSERQK